MKSMLIFSYKAIFFKNLLMKTINKILFQKHTVFSSTSYIVLIHGGYNMIVTVWRERTEKSALKRRKQNFEIAGRAANISQIATVYYQCARYLYYHGTCRWSYQNTLRDQGVFG